MKMADTTNNGPVNASSALSSLASPFPIDLKKTKIVWGQPALSAPITWTETMMDLVAFRNMLQDRTVDGPLTAIPSEHLRLISELTQESDKDLKGLVMDIQAALAPESISTNNSSSSNSTIRKDNDIIPAKIVESAINGVAKRINYGIDGGLKDFCVWRWEVEDFDNLPARLRDSLRQRRADREKAQSILLARFESLPESEKKALLTKAKQKKTEASAGGKENIPAPEPAVAAATSTAPSQSTPAPPQPQPTVLKAETSTPTNEKKEKDSKPKKAATTKQKESAPVTSNKSSLFNYFAPKPNQTASSTTPKLQTNVDSNEIKPEPRKPAFEEIFRPFRAKKGTELAPSNYFRVLKNDVIVLDHDGEDTMKTENKSAPEDLLDALRNTLAPASGPCRTSYKRIHSSAPSLKTTSQLSVRDLIEQFNDATLAGDVNTAKLLVATLSNRKKLPLSWLYFYENTRPMYVGTWTKTSTVIGPRSPFAKEEGVDYAYDSGEEWQEEEEEGEEMEDLDTIDGDEEEEEEEDNGDWIVDDDQEELEQDEEDGDLVLSLDEIGSGLIPLPSKGKRKADNVFSFKNKRRKVTTLKPDCKGPFWETTLGEARLPSLSQYAVRVLNETPLSIDPFVVYGEPAGASATSKHTDGFVVPAIPDRLLATSNTTSPNATPTSKKQGATQGAAKAGPSRLPDHLMQKMAALVLDAPSDTTQVLLVGQVYQALKAEGAKKNAVEATLKQVFEKVKGQRRWVVKEEFKNMLGSQSS